MSHHVRDRRPTLCITIVAAAIALAPLPVMAGPASSSPTSHGIRASIQKAVSAELKTSVDSSASTRNAAAAQADLSTPNFFKTPAGIITLVAIGVGVGYAIYSTSHDRVKSPGR